MKLQSLLYINLKFLTISKITIKEVFENDNWIITKILQGSNKTVRIDAKTRFHKPDKQNFFSEWASTKYAYKLALENYGKKTSDFSCFEY